MVATGAGNEVTETRGTDAINNRNPDGVECSTLSGSCGVWGNSFTPGSATLHPELPLFKSFGLLLPVPFLCISSGATVVEVPFDFAQGRLFGLLFTYHILINVLINRHLSIKNASQKGAVNVIEKRIL
jgi:hypothetical protein